MVLLSVLEQWFSNFTIHRNQTRGFSVHSMHTPEPLSNHDSTACKNKIITYGMMIPCWPWTSHLPTWVPVASSQNHIQFSNICILFCPPPQELCSRTTNSLVTKDPAFSHPLCLLMLSASSVTGILLFCFVTSYSGCCCSAAMPNSLHLCAY